MSPHPNSIRILAVDDHSQFREGIAVLLATHPDMNLVAQAVSVRAGPGVSCRKPFFSYSRTCTS